ncbi:MAG: PEP-CTERM sorting domain-containing protein [Verrucomicrobia bacterium]|nr:PEP-CTERM sorting domain-containing protein [Verrucomicrobiota bacterium]
MYPKAVRPAGSRVIAVLIAFLFSLCSADAQILWDGGAGSSLWSGSQNWKPNGVPISSEDVILDNSEQSFTNRNIIYNAAVGANTTINSLRIGNPSTLAATNSLLITTNLTVSTDVNLVASNGLVRLVLGAGATNTIINGTLTVTNSGSGVSLVTVSNATSLRAGTLSLAGQFSNSGTVNITNAFIQRGGNYSQSGGLLIVGPGGIIVGSNSSSSSMTFSNGAVVTNAGQFVVGSAATANSNSVLMTGPGTVMTMTSAAPLVIGSNGSFNTLTLSNSASVTAGGLIQVGALAGASNNTLTVTDSGTLLGGGNEIWVGSSGMSNTMRILNGATVTNSSWVQVGRNAAGKYNTLVVSGAGSVLSNAANGILVGNGGLGNLAIITNGAYVVTPMLALGWGASGVSNTAIIGGTGTQVRAIGSGITVGTNSAFNTLTIASGAVVTNLGRTVVGGSAGATGNFLLVTDAGTYLTNAGQLRVGDFASQNMMVISNGATVLNAGVGFIGAVAGANNNTVLVTGSGSLWRNAGDLNVGFAGSSNQLLIAGGVVAATNLVVGSGAGSVGNLLAISGGSLYVTNTARGGALDVRRGGFTLSGGTAVVNRLYLTNGASSPFTFSAGTLAVGGSAVSNGSAFLVGNGASAATLRLMGGTHSFANGLIITNNAILTGTGLINGMLNLQGGAKLGGDGTSGTLTVNNDTYWFGDASYDWEVNNFTGTAGTTNGWDLLQINAGLILTNVSVANPFKVNLVTIQPGTGTPGAAANWSEVNGSWVIIRASNGIVNFSPTTYGIDTTGFQNDFAGSFGLQVSGSTNLLLTYSAPDIWTNGVGGNWSVGGNWLAGTAPTGSLSAAILFRGNGVATNNNPGAFTLNHLTFQLGPGSNQTLRGGNLVFGETFSAPRIDQDSNGVARIENNMIFSNTVTISVTGNGSLALNGDISGTNFNKTGGSLLGLYGNNTFTGPVSISGLLNYTNTSAFGAAGNVITLDGATVQITNTFSESRAFALANGVGVDVNAGNTYTLTGGLLGAGDLTKTNGGTLVLTGNSALGGSVYVSGGALTISGGGTLTNGSGILGFGAGSSSSLVTVSGAGSLWNNTNELDVGYSGSGNQLVITNGGRVAAAQVIVGRNSGSQSNLVLLSGGNLVATSGSGLDIRRGAFVNANQSTSSVNNLTLGAAAVITNDATSTFYIAGLFDNQSTNNQANNNWSGRWVFSGTITQRVEMASNPQTGFSNTNFYFGTLSVGDPLTGSNAFVMLVDTRTNTAGAGSEILVASNLTVATAGSTLDLNSRTALVLNLSNTGTIQQVNGGGTLGAINAVNTFTNQGRIFVANGSLMQFSNSFVNAASGTIFLRNGSILTNFISGSTLTNYGTIEGVGTLKMTVGNEGTIQASGGVLRLSGGFTNSGGAGGGPVNAGLLQALGGGSELVVNSGFTNLGTINLAAGTVTVSRIVNQNLVSGYGAFNAALDNSARVTNDSGGLMTFALPVVNRTNGSIIARGSSSFSFGGAFNNAGGLVRVADQSLATFNAVVTNLVNSRIEVANQSRLTFNAGVTNFGHISVLGPSTAVFNGNLLLGPSGIITASATNSVIFMRSNFFNFSTNNMAFDMRNATVIFGDAGTLPDGSAQNAELFGVAGTNKGATWDGFNNNFAVHEIIVTNLAKFTNPLDDNQDTNNALYVDILHVYDNVNLHINHITVYVSGMFINDQIGQTFTYDSTAAYNHMLTSTYPDLPLMKLTIGPDAAIIFLAAIPEPSTAALFGAGVLFLAGRRRRKPPQRADFKSLDRPPPHSACRGPSS